MATETFDDPLFIFFYDVKIVGYQAIGSIKNYDWIDFRNVGSGSCDLPLSGNPEIGDVIKNVYGRIKLFFVKNQDSRLTFSRLLPENANKEDKVFTFIPLLHLTNQRKIELEQEQHFGEIEIEHINNSIEGETVTEEAS